MHCACSTFPHAPSAQAVLTFASELQGLFLLGSPAASPVEGESLREAMAMCICAEARCVWMGGHADTQPNAVVDFYELAVSGDMVGVFLILVLDHFCQPFCCARPRRTQCRSPLRA